jgi:hypothetical protein
MPLATLAIIVFMHMDAKRQRLLYFPLERNYRKDYFPFRREFFGL